MNTMPLIAFTPGSLSGKGPEGSSGVKANQPANRTENGRDKFSQILKKATSQQDTAPKTSESDNQKQSESQPVAEKPSSERDAVVSREDQKPGHGDSANELGQVAGTGVLEGPVSPKQENVVKLQDETQVSGLLAQLAEILKSMGIAVQTDAATVNGEKMAEEAQKDGQSSLAALLNSAPVNQEGMSLKELLQKLTAILNNTKALPDGLKELKLLAQSGLNGESQLPARDFMAKLMESVQKVLQQAAETNQAVGEMQESNPKIFSAAIQVNNQNHVNPSKTITEAPDNQADARVERLPLNNESGYLSEGGKESKGNAQEGSPGFKALSTGFQAKETTVIDHKPTMEFKMPLQSELVTNTQTVPETMKADAVTPMPRMTQMIFGQIAQSAKLVIEPGVTQMHIQLKPEFLGKLNLSITSDNGLVTAKFSAESHAVKGIIEANLNNLKDALAQQGVKVDQLVVDVGTQGHQSGFENREGFFGSQNGKKNSMVAANNEKLDEMFSRDVQSGAISDYYGSTVEYTA